MILARLILGFLAIAPMTGYDLMRAFSSSAAHFWEADKAQIYRTLAKLVAEGHARTEQVTGTGAPDRIVHHLTPLGRQALHKWLASPPDRQAERDPFLARLFVAEPLTDAELTTLLRARHDAAARKLAALRELRSATPAPGPREDRGAWLRSRTLDEGIGAHAHHLAWIDETLDALEGTDHEHPAPT